MNASNLMTLVVSIIIIIVVVIALTLSGNKKMEDSKITDCGVKQIAENLYLKKLVINSDHIYLLVDKDGNLVSTDVSSSFYVGKTRRFATFLGAKSSEER